MITANRCKECKKILRNFNNTNLCSYHYMLNNKRKKLTTTKLKHKYIKKGDIN